MNPKRTIRRRHVASAPFSDWLADPHAVILDTETTGLGANAEIIEIAVIDMQGTVLLDTLVQPTCRITNEHVHGITNRDVRDAPPWPAIYDQLLGFADGRAVVVYNAAFDRRMIEQSCQRHGILSPLACDWHCAMKAYSWQSASPPRRWISLTSACRAWSVPIEDAHRALGDCLLTLSLMRAVAARGHRAVDPSS